MNTGDLSKLFSLNSCQFDLIPGKRGGIRIKSEIGRIIVMVKDSDDASYRECSAQNYNEGPFSPFIMVASQNDGNIVNDIDLDAIYIKNTDPRVY